ncbi:MAG: pyridoxamine 5'-phosphate oxidase [Qingshengfaniella sp.]
MSDRTGIFAGTDPFVLARTWLAEAAAVEPNDPTAMALATVDCGGLPNVRMVLLKDIEEDGFTFFTNYESTKAREIEHAGTAAFVLHWKSLRRQVRARGAVERIAAARSDAYFKSRSPESRLGACASQQSRPLNSRKALEDKLAEMRLKWDDNPPRPSYWGGYKLRPQAMEFWADGPHRLHDRFLWTRSDPHETWRVIRLNP